MQKGVFNIIIDAFVFIGIGSILIERWQVGPWAIFVLLLLIGICCWIANLALIKYFITKRAPDMMSHDEALGDTEFWELTAGLGIVPKWVSHIGLWSISAFMASLLFLLWSMVGSGSG